MDFTDLAYGTNEHRREPAAHRRAAPRQQQPERESMGDDMMDLGKLAVGGMITVGVLGAMGNMMHKD